MRRRSRLQIETPQGCCACRIARDGLQAVVRQAAFQEHAHDVAVTGLCSFYVRRGLAHVPGCMHMRQMVERGATKAGCDRRATKAVCGRPHARRTRPRPQHSARKHLPEDALPGSSYCNTDVIQSPGKNPGLRVKMDPERVRCRKQSQAATIRFSPRTGVAAAASLWATAEIPHPVSIHDSDSPSERA